jgi:hypothetical protein
VALQLSTLKRGLLDIQRNFPATHQEAGARWAAAYSAYCKDAQSVLGGSPVSLDAGEAVLGRMLGITFATSKDPVSTASAFASALTAFWLLPPVAFTGVPPGLVTAVAGTAVLQVALPATWAGLLLSRASAEKAMGDISTVMDAFTRTVFVTHLTVPSPTIGPIS